MPINPKYKFLSETGPGGNAFGAGMALWGGPSEAPQRATPYIPGGLTPDIVNAVRAARQTQPAQPAPQVNRPATQPVAPVAPMQPMAQPEQFQYEPMEEFDVNGPYISEQRTTQAGMEGIGSWDSLPMGEQGTKILPPNAMAPVREDEPAQLSNPEIPENFDRTTISQKAQAMGMDPRQLFVALAELSAGLGNIKGQPQQSTARGFYEMQKKYENQDRDNAMRAMQLEQPKQANPLDATRMELMRAQTDLARNKAQTEQELNDPTSPRSKALRSALEVYMQKSMGIPQWKSMPEMTGTDVYKWLSPLNFAIGQQMQSQRAAEQIQSTERQLQDRLDFQAQMKAADPLAEQYKQEQIKLMQARRREMEAGRGGGTANLPEVAGGEPKMSQKAVKMASELRKEYQNNAVTKTTRDVKTQWNKVKDVLENPSAAGDMAAIFMFMKTLDPGSTVREGEYKSAAEATSAAGRVQTYAQNVSNGSKLNPEQRLDFKRTIEKFYRAQMKEQERVNREYRALAERSGIDARDLMIESEDGAAPQKLRSVHDLPDAR